MKKFIATVLCLVLALSVAGCGSVPKPGEGDGSKPLTYTDSAKNEISFNEEAGLFSVNGAVYHATGKSYGEAICGEEIKNLALPISDGRTVTAWSPMYEGIIVVLIDGEWQEFKGEEGNDELPDNCIMTATVIEIGNGTMLVEPEEGSWELSSCDRFSVPIEHMNASPEPRVGDIIEITYDGSIEETYPASLGNITHIEVIRETNGTDEPTGERQEICIDDVFYANTGMAVPAEPDESVIEYVEIPCGGNATIKAFARIQEGNDSYLLCLIDGEWYKFIAE